MVYFRGILFAGMLIFLFGCNGNSNIDTNSEADIVQKSDGRILLSLEDAYLLNDKKFPKRNTAEWNFTVTDKGRYEVWLISYTKDTMNLSYDKPVIVHFGDTRLEALPIGNEIVLGDNRVEEPYYRADSRIGSILIEDTGNYNIQIISEKVVPSEESANNAAWTIMNRIMLKPQTR